MEKTGSKRTDKYISIDDAALVSRTISGEREAFSELIARHESALVNFISTFSPIIQDSEDICQESFKRAYTSLGSYDSRYAFSTWLYSIAKNTAIDLIRKQNNTPTTLVSGSEEEYRNSTEIESSPEDNYIGKQTYNSLLEEIDKLDPLYREVAKLRLIDEYAYEEIAKKLEMPLNTVRTRLRRAKVILSDKIQK